MSDQTQLADETDDIQTRTIIDFGDIDLDDLDGLVEASLVPVEDGALVEGVVVRIDKDEVLLDIGYKSEGFIPVNELSIRNDIDPNEVVSIGDELEALVMEKEDKDGRLKLSKKRAQYERAWGKIEEIKEAEGVVTGPVIEVVKGGLILDVGLRGFLPASLVDLRRVRDLQPFVGQELECKIIELDKNRNNVVLSRRAYLEETQAEQRNAFLAELKPGEVREGVVSSVVNFGAFVDLGGMDGLVHVSELSWKHVDHPGSVVTVGDEVKVQVLDVDLDRERISLSLKACQEDPWEAFAREHSVNDVVPGKVTKLVPFGAFVSVADGIEGLVHISEMSEEHVELPDQVVHVGEDVQVKIIDVDLARRRISLSIKQAGGTTSGGYDESVYKSKDEAKDARAERPAPRPAYGGGAGFKIGDEHAEALGELRDQLEQQAEADEAEAAAEVVADATEESSADDEAESAAEVVADATEESSAADEAATETDEA
jgi:small subunit ribosomal protein S1